ncbi:MAG: hypothetical protein H0X24_02575 [Ktedonobacterales bacterium]|nr:hypothetical protein [Ktedonobacterales bacterium]
MPTVPTSPNTLGVLRALQTLLLNNALIGGVSPFAALGSADATRYGVARAIYIGAPKDFKDGYLPQCQLVAEGDAVTRAGAQGRATDEVLVRITAVADLTDWWTGEQTILALRDAIWPVLLAHVRGGASTGTGFVALEQPDAEPHPNAGFGMLEVAGVWYRTWTCHVLARQLWTPSGGLVP